MSPEPKPPAPAASRAAQKPKKGCLKKLLIGCLGATVLLALLGYLAWQVPFVQETFYIVCLSAPKESMRCYSARRLADSPNDRAIAALVHALNRVDYKDDPRFAVAVLTSLCLISGEAETFGVQFSGTKHGYSMGHPSDSEWPHVVARVNAWAALRTLGSILGAGLAEKPPAAELPVARILKLLDQMTDPNPEVGGRAWIELSALYNYGPDFDRNVGHALSDTRPIHFLVEEETFGDPPQRYFTTKLRPITAADGKPLATTVGEAIRFDYWRYEGAGASGYKGPFEEWWRLYEAKRQRK